ncbi:MAG: glycosyltransferase [Bacilli bacterium]
MKMLYISPWDMNPNGRFNGSAKKTRTFISEFNKVGIDTHLYNNYKVCEVESLNKIIARLPYTCVFNKLIYTHELDGYNVYYIRFLGSDYPFLRFIKLLRKNNLNSKIILEFPDIDYMSHFEMNIRNIPFYLKDKFFSKKVHKYIDRTVVMGNVESYHNIPCINIYNGIDVKSVKMRRVKKDVKSCIHFGIVASIQPVHGIDIFINSIQSYYKSGGKRNLVFDIVGGGTEEKKLIKLVNLLGLNKRVVFHGFKFDEELESLYDVIDIGICELAPERRNYSLSSSLKSREYLAKGLPIIASVDIDIFNDKPFDYFLKLNSNNSLIDIRKCIDFYDSIYVNNEEAIKVATDIRKFAIDNIDMSEVIKPILNYIFKNKEDSLI